MKNQREGPEYINWRSKDPKQYRVLTLNKIRRLLIVNAFVEGKLVTFTVDARATVSIHRAPWYSQTQLCFYTLADLV